jgi:hypothetical protein
MKEFYHLITPEGRSLLLHKNQMSIHQLQLAMKAESEEPNECQACKFLASGNDAKQQH